MRFEKGLLFVFLVSLIPLLNLLTPGLLVSHDAWLHGGRLASFYQSLSEGILIPRWAGNLNLGFGNPVLMFVYPLPSYLGSVLHFLGLSYTDSIKTLLAISYTLSGIFMYLWIKEFLGKNAGIVAAVLYLYAPYRFIDLYIRGALGEHMAFVFLPLIGYALLRLHKLKNDSSLKSYYLLSIFSAISFMLLVLTHNAISLLFIPFIIFYSLYLFFESKSKLKLFITFSSLGYGAFLSFFFWFPAFMEGKYTLRDILTAGEYSKHFVDPISLLYGPWIFGGSGIFTVQIGIAHLILVLLSLVFFKKIFKKNDKQRIFYLGTLIIFIGSIFLMIKESNFIWEILTTLPKIQFPWRFLAIVTFCTSIIGAIFISKFNKNKIMILIILTAIIPTFSYWHAKAYDKSFTDSYFENEFKGTTDTGEVSPIWSIRFMEEMPKDDIEIIDGEAQIKKVDRNSTFHEYVINANKRTRIRENTLYFPGWKVYDNENLVTEVEFQDPKNRGLITFYVDEGLHSIIIRFEDTKLRKFANLVSLISLSGLLVLPLILLTQIKLKIKK
ncbi:MAG: hypothetical protein KBD51_00655 [Candidatus Levybacteria bacterium]|nr:hypothetical protein [Candidatus Levybacteria bacterium]